MVLIKTSKSLDKTIREGKMPRREFLKKAGKILGGIGVSTLPIINSGCGKSNPVIPPTPTPVNLNFEVYNHTQGYLTNFTKNPLSGEPVTINIADLNVSGVDDKRIVVRYEHFGNLVSSNLTNGEAMFTAPGQNTNYDVYLMNALAGAPYQVMDDKSAQLLNNLRYFVVNRRDFDGQTGPERVWGAQPLPEIGGNYGVFDQLAQAITYPWANYGSINRQPNASRADFSYGYGDSEGNEGRHYGYKITVNANRNPTILEKVSIGLIEAFENITMADDPNADVLYQGVLQDIGKDLFAYVFVKDSYAPVNKR